MDIRKLEELNKNISKVIDDTGKEVEGSCKRSDLSKDLDELHNKLQETHIDVYNIIRKLKRVR